MLDRTANAEAHAVGKHAGRRQFRVGSSRSLELALGKLFGREPWAMPTDLTPYVVTGLFALGAGLIGVGGTLGGQWLAQQSESQRDAARKEADTQRDKRSDERAIRDRKAERLRRAYQELLILAIDMSVRAWRWRQLPAEIQKLPDDQRVARAEQLVEEAASRVGKQIDAIMLESDTHSAEVLDIFFRIDEALRELFFSVAHELQQPTDEGSGVAKELVDKIQLEVNRLGDIVRAHLAELEKPI